MTIADAISRFLKDLSLGLSENTVNTYSTALSRFSDFLLESSVDPNENSAAELNVNHATEFVHWLIDDHFADTSVSKATLRTYLAASARFYSYLIREKIADISAEEHERLKGAYQDFRKGGYRRLPKPAADDLVEALIEAARSVPAKTDDRRHELCRLRNVGILETLRCTGIRVGELVSLRRGDLSRQDQTARVIGKGDKERVVYFDDVAWRSIQIYLKYRQDSVRGRAFYDLPIFARHDRAAGSKTLPISTNTVRHIFEDLRKQAGIEQPITPHALRHAFATKALEVTEDLAVVQDLLGHASPTTTRVYAKVRSKRLRDAHQKMFGYEDAKDAGEE